MQIYVNMLIIIIFDTHSLSIITGAQLLIMRLLIIMNVEVLLLNILWKP